MRLYTERYMPRAATHTASGTAGAQIEQRSTGMHAASHGTVHARAATHTASGSAGAYVDRKIDGHTCFVKRDGTCLEPPLIRRVDGRRSYLSARGIRGVARGARCTQGPVRGVCRHSNVEWVGRGSRSPTVRGMRDAARGSAGTYDVRSMLHNTAAGCGADTHTSSVGRRSRRAHGTRRAGHSHGE